MFTIRIDFVYTEGVTESPRSNRSSLFSSEPEERDDSSTHTDDNDTETDAPPRRMDYITDPANFVDNPDDVRNKRRSTVPVNGTKEDAPEEREGDLDELRRSSQRIQKRRETTRQSVNDVTRKHLELLSGVAQAASLLDPDRKQDMAVLFIKQVDTMSTAQRIANMVYFGWFRQPESVIWQWGRDTWDGVTESQTVSLDTYVRDLAVDMYKHVAMHIAGGETKDGKMAERMYLGERPSLGEAFKQSMRKNAS